MYFYLSTSVLFFSRPPSEVWLQHGRTFSIYLCLLSFWSTLPLCPRIDVVHPGCVWFSSPAYTWHFSLHYLFFQATPLFPHDMTIVCYIPCFDSSLFTSALSRTHLFVFFAFHETRRIFLSYFISKASRRVFSFFLSVQLSQSYVATGHTSALIGRIFVEIGMMWLFHIFCSDALITCRLCNLVWNSVVHLLYSVTRGPMYGNLSTCSSCSLWIKWISMRHAMPSLAITLILSTLMSRLYLRLNRSRQSSSSCSSASEVSNRMTLSA